MSVLHSIQGRIVLGSVLIAAVVLAVIGVVVAQQMRHVAGASVATLTREELIPFLADLRNQPGEQPDRPGVGQMILIVSPAGTAVVDTMPAGLAAAVERSGSGMSRIHAAGVSYVAAGEQVTNADGTWRVWALRDAVAADQTLQAFGRVLLLTVPVVLVLVALGSWLLVRTALRPVRRLRTAAERIQDSGVEQRLPEGQGRDELAALAVTLNSFLDAQRDGVERERRMVADASHELRTPLAVLTTQLELADEHPGDAVELQRTVQAAKVQVRAISRLTTQLLELSQLESDAGGPARDESSVSELISEAMAAVDRARVLAPAGVPVEFELEGDLAEEVRAPMGAVVFGRIVDNLTSNALRATTEGAVEIRVVQTESALRLVVLDTGAGVPIEFLPHAFERFARSERSRAAGAGGSGLGLALVQALANAAGGSVGLENRPDGGAVATVQIPLRPRPVAAAPPTR